MASLKKGINYWCFPGSFAGEVDPVAAIRWAKQYGYEVLELCIGDPGYPLATDSPASLLQELVKVAEGEGVGLPSVASGLYWARSVGDIDPAVRAAAKEDLKRSIDITHGLGAKALLTIPGAVDVFFLPDRPVQPQVEVMKYAKEGIAELLPHAEAAGVTLAIENVWNKLFMTSTELIDFIDSFGSKNVGSYFDVGNVLPFGYPQDWIRALGHRIAAVHFKDYRKAAANDAGFVDLLEGDVNWPEVVTALGEIGYNGAVVAEMIPHYTHHPIVRVKNTSNAMDAILGRV